MPKPAARISATSIWSFDHLTDPLSESNGAEVVVYDPLRETALVLGGDGVDILGADDGAWMGGLAGDELANVSATDALDEGELGGANSATVHGNHVAVTYNNATAGLNGWVALYTLDADGDVAAVKVIESGAVPDMATFTLDGARLLVAIEGEPTANYASDPVGGVQVIDTATGASAFVGFDGFDTDALRAAGVRITGPAGTLATTDLEPEYIAISADGNTAYVTLQENNAVAVLDLDAAGGPVFTNVFALGAKDWSHPANTLDASDRDGPGRDPLPGNFQNWPIYSLYMPDAIATFDKNGKTYLVTANEGDGREWGTYADEARVKDLDLDPTAFPDAEFLQDDDNLGRLTVLSTEGDVDGDGDYDALYALGGRSFSIWEVQKDGLKLTFDSADLIERTIFDLAPQLYFDDRSDNKGPEPEHVTVAELWGEVYAFVGLERSNAIMAFEVTGPQKAEFAGLIYTDGDVGPETFTVVEGAEEGSAILYVASEVSGTSRAYGLSIEETGVLGGPPITVPEYVLI